MPLYKTIAVNSQTTVKIWKVDESFEALIKQVELKPKSKSRVLGMKSELHQRGFLSVRCLLNEFGYKDEELHYDANGRPYLEDGNYISITHSFQFSGVIVSEIPVGIDIEKQREKVKKIAPKFVDYEFNYLNKLEGFYVRKLTIIWCIKESLYKLYASPGLSFKNHCLVIPFNIQDEETLAWIDFEGKKSRYNVKYLEFEGFSCAYAFS